MKQTKNPRQEKRRKKKELRPICLLGRQEETCAAWLAAAIVTVTTAFITEGKGFYVLSAEQDPDTCQER